VRDTWDFPVGGSRQVPSKRDFHGVKGVPGPGLSFGILESRSWAMASRLGFRGAARELLKEEDSFGVSDRLDKMPRRLR